MLNLIFQVFFSTTKTILMKIQSFYLAIIVLFFTGSATFAQDSKNTLKVWGNCGMCEEVIEKAAKKAGATTADWNKDTKVLSVSYNAKTSNTQKIEQAIAAAGYDTENFTANNQAYGKLPGCCKYDRKSAKTAADAVSETKHQCTKENCDKCKHDEAVTACGEKCEKGGCEKCKKEKEKSVASCGEKCGKECKDGCKDGATCKSKGCGKKL